MQSDPTDGHQVGSRRTLVSGLWLVLAFAACMSVSQINGGPLFYFDSGGYLDNGLKVLGQLGLDLSSAADAGGELDGSSGPDEPDVAVNGSRSVIYSVFATLAGLGLGLKSIPVLHTVLLFCAVWIPVRVASREYQPQFDESKLVAIPITVAAIGALPFYIAYLMPDILSGILLIVIACLTVFARQMTFIEIFFALALGCLAVVSHLSHLAVLGLMVPVVAVISILSDRRKWWLPTALVGAILVAGLSERAAFQVVAEKVADSEVVYYPFLTARLVHDGPGLDYLEANCPDENIPTCALHEAFLNSDDPMRFTASHIIFETSAALGSFRLMPSEDQQRVANQQFKFFFQVLAQYPVSTVGALIKNTLIQARKNSIQMTIPKPHVIERLSMIQSLPDNLFQVGRLSLSRSWIGSVNAAHQFNYAISLILIVALVLWPGKVAWRLKLFAVMLILGILANAFVCGGISQPADRYGARVIWLLPLVAAILVMFSTPGRHAATTGAIREGDVI